jgi:hypothetical protein
MIDRERIINEFKQAVGSFTPADTSDEYFKELCCSVLELLKEQDESEFVRERIQTATAMFVSRR